MPACSASRYNDDLHRMARVLRLLIVTACLLVPRVALAATADVTLFRLFMLDGTTFVSYGEFVRLDESVIFSMPVGGPPDQPRLQVATVQAALVDWTRTERYAASARFQRYAETRGEEDYQQLSNEVADALNTIALTTDRQQALAVAERVQQMVAAWPQQHYGYRHNDVREILSVLDQAVSSLRAVTGTNRFELSLVALISPPETEPVMGMPNVREQIDQVLRLSTLTTSPSDRMALLQSALGLVAEAGAVLASEADSLRRTAERQIRNELTADRRYADLSRRMMDQATRAVDRADGRSIERLITRVPQEDQRLGRQRPQVVEALTGSLQGRLADARQMRLLRDQWVLRRSIYNQYQRTVGWSVVTLVKSTASLEAIRKLDGPHPDQLAALQNQLAGGAERLQRMQPPEYLRDVHERLIGAWRFAENAARARFEAISKADTASAWQASSSAAGALMMLSRVQQDLTALLAPPKLQ